MRDINININQATTIISILYINNALFGFVKSIMILNGFCLLCMVLWFIVALMEAGFLQACFDVCNPLIVYIVFLVVVYFYSGIQLSSDSFLWQNLRNAFFSLICSFLCLYILQQDKESKRKVLFFLLINIILGSLYTLYRIQENPLLPRILSKGTEGVAAALEGVSKAGILTYGGIYGMSLIFPSFVYWISKENGLRKLVLIIISIIAITTIFQAQFAIALIFLIISVFLYLILCRGQSKNRIVISFLFFLIALIVALNWDSILSVVYNADILPSALQQKAQELLLYSEGDDINGTNLGSRSTFYTQTFEAIAQNYFLGNVFFNKASALGHSEWEDMAANYGIIAPILVYIFFYKFAKRIIPYFEKNAIMVYRVQLLQFLLIGFVDPIFHSRTMSYLLFLSPLILSIYQKNSLETSVSATEEG